MKGKHLSLEQKRMILRLRGQGMLLKEIARAAGCQKEVVWSTISRMDLDRAKPAVWQPRKGNLTIADREEILIGLTRGETFTAIAQAIGKSTSCVSREVAANGGRQAYRAWGGYVRARERAQRPKPTKFAACPALCDEVTKGLEDLWSPDEISCRLRLEHPDDPMMRVSHETIYKSLFVQGRGELRRELTRCLRSGRVHRKTRKTGEYKGPIRDMIMISDRPAEIEDRAVPGHWEGDLIIGKKNLSCVGTLVERSTRYVMLLHLPEGQGAASVQAAMQKAVAGLPAEMMKSITWDQGREMANHREFTVETDIPIYFCDPRSPWQRGSNENTNGLLRQYMPKKMDLSVFTQEDLAEIARSLNNRPRRTLEYLKPSEKIAELFALTG